MPSKRIPHWIIMFPLVLFISNTFAEENDGEPVDQSKPKCPENTINSGWFVRKAYAFSNPLDCCDTKVSGWKSIDDYDAPYLETGCNLVIPIQSGSISRFIYPVSCNSSSECGEKDFFGNRIECCQNVKNGFCAGIGYSQISRCDKVKEYVDMDEQEKMDEEAAFNDFDNFKQDCYSMEENGICMTCSSSCPEGTHRVHRGSQRVPGSVSVEDRISNMVDGSKRK